MVTLTIGLRPWSHSLAKMEISKPTFATLLWFVPQALICWNLGCHRDNIGRWEDLPEVEPGQR